jgi:tRNA (cmo5U34)-methyltransferase
MNDMPWSEDDSRHFIDIGAVYTPGRDEIRDAILDLIPAERDEPFLAVEIAVGSGWLSRAILERFPRARILGLDGSPAMLAETEKNLAAFSGRFELSQFRLEDESWPDEITEPARCFVSVLTVHHLDDAAKRALYRRLHDHLDGRGAVLIGDIVAPASEWERRYLAHAWDTIVQQQSLALTGNAGAYEEFRRQQWNILEYPDPVDMPSRVPDHLAWLTEAGFGGVNVFWARGAHAVYGGYQRLAA